MTLQQQHDTCDERIRTIDDMRWLLPTSPRAADVLSASGSLSDLASTWTGSHIARPSGSPDAVEQSAERLESLRDDLDAVALELETRATEVEAAMDADAGRASAVRLRAMGDLATLEASGLRVLAAGVRDYAESLADARDDVGRAAGDVWAARHAASSVDVPESYDADWTDAECQAGIAAIDGVYADAAEALGSVRDALANQIEAEALLGYAVSDANGYARLAALPTSPSTTSLDAVLALVDGIGDPDRAVVSDAEWAAYVAARDELSDAERARLDAALEDAGSATARQIIVSALATDAGLDATLALADRLETMTDSEVAAVAGIGLPDAGGGVAGDGVDVLLPDGTRVAQQTDTTCGSASLLMLAAQRDPFLALLLSQGEVIGDHIPAYLEGIPLIDAIADADLTSEERLEYLETQVRIQTNQFTFWPGSAVGSAPWGYGDEVADVLGTEVDFDYSVLGPHGDAQALVDGAIAAVDDGTPVPFLVGPEGTDVPRHYVLLVGHSAGELQFYEPGSGQLHTIAIDDAVAGDGGWTAAFGGWSSIYGAAIPTG